jgi:acyl-CoA reductase-like NAD-dependent aldehyde dehydrogenase
MRFCCNEATPTNGHFLLLLLLLLPPLVQPVGSPKLNKRVTAELGNVTPYIIVPGPWSQEDMEYHATSVASGLAQNAGHNCIAAEVRNLHELVRPFVYAAYAHAVGW